MFEAMFANELDRPSSVFLNIMILENIDL